MISSDLQFSFEHLPAVVLVLIPLILNLVIFIYVLFNFQHNKLTRVFYFLLAFICIWQLADLLVHLSANMASAYYWHFLLSPFMHLIPALSLHFVLLFTKRKKLARSPGLIFSVYFVALLFFFLSLGNQIKFHVVPSKFWAWLTIEENNLPSQISAFWNVLLTLFTIYLLGSFYLSLKKKNESGLTQAKLIFLGFVIPSAISIITEFVLPIIFVVEPIPLLSITLSVFSFCIIVALKKHELLSFSPRHAWTNIINSMNEGLLIVNNNDEIQFANKFFCEMTGYELQDLLNKKAASLLNSEFEKTLLKEKLSNRKEGISERYEVNIRKKTGETICCTISGSPYYDRMGNVIGSIGIHTDITDKKRAELALIESESNLRFFMEESLLGIYSLDPNTKRIVWANSAFLNLMGFSAEEISTIPVYSFIDHSSENVDQRIELVLREKKQRPAERSWKRKDGKIIKVLVSSLCINTDRKDIIYVTSQDITEFKQLENSLNQKIRDLNIFLYQVSHDIKGPLASILGLADIASRETEDLNQKKYLGMIEQSTKKLDNTLNALLEIIFITKGKLKLQIINLDTEIAEVKNNLTSLSNFSKIIFHERIILPEDFITDKVMLGTILQNLIANSINYANFNNKESFVKVFAEQINDIVLIIIEDNGVGIPKELQSKIWDMFFRGSELSKGTGLGLFIVHNAVERLGGTITVESEPGKGTKFTVTIPNNSGEILNN